VRLVLLLSLQTAIVDTAVQNKDSKSGDDTNKIIETVHCDRMIVYSRLQCLYIGPEVVATPRVTDVEAFSVRLTWTSPTQPNGVIVNYHIYQNDNLSHNVSHHVCLSVCLSVCVLTG